MRKVVAQLFISLDGVVESPENWRLEHWNDELRAAVASQLLGTGLLDELQLR